MAYDHSSSRLGNVSLDKLGAIPWVMTLDELWKDYIEGNSPTTVAPTTDDPLFLNDLEYFARFAVHRAAKRPVLAKNGDEATGKPDTQRGDWNPGFKTTILKRVASQADSWRDLSCCISGRKLFTEETLYDAVYKEEREIWLQQAWAEQFWMQTMPMLEEALDGLANDQQWQNIQQAVQQHQSEWLWWTSGPKNLEKLKLALESVVFAELASVPDSAAWEAFWHSIPDAAKTFHKDYKHQHEHGWKADWDEHWEQHGLGHRADDYDAQWQELKTLLESADPRTTGQPEWSEVKHLLPSHKLLEFDHMSYETLEAHNPSMAGLSTAWADVRDLVKADMLLYIRGVMTGYYLEHGYLGKNITRARDAAVLLWKHAGTAGEEFLQLIGEEPEPSPDTYWEQPVSARDIFYKGFQHGKHWSPAIAANNSLTTLPDFHEQWQAQPNGMIPVTRKKAIKDLDAGAQQRMTFFDLSRLVYQQYKPLLRDLFHLEPFVGIALKEENGVDGERNSTRRKTRTHEDVEREVWKFHGAITGRLQHWAEDHSGYALILQALLESKESRKSLESVGAFRYGE